jgi:hypothetical protein
MNREAKSSREYQQAEGNSILKILLQGWDVARWYSACLEGFWRWFLPHHKKTKHKKKKKKPLPKNIITDSNRINL